MSGKLFCFVELTDHEGVECFCGMGQLDLCHLQDGFASLVKQADPEHLPSFFLWLDLKVAQFKISGNFIPGLAYVYIRLRFLPRLISGRISSSLQETSFCPLICIVLQRVIELFHWKGEDLSHICCNAV